MKAQEYVARLADFTFKADGRKKMHVILQGVTELALHSPGTVPAAAGVAGAEGVGTPLA